MKELQGSPEGWALLAADDGSYILSVPSSIGELKVPLTFEEKNEYMTAGTVYLDLMASRVRDRPEKYRDRSV